LSDSEMWNKLKRLRPITYGRYADELRAAELALYQDREARRGMAKEKDKAHKANLAQVKIQVKGLIDRLSKVTINRRDEDDAYMVAVEFNPRLFAGGKYVDKALIAERIARRVHGDILTSVFVEKRDERSNHPNGGPA
jgi:hypothetical protein